MPLRLPFSGSRSAAAPWGEVPPGVKVVLHVGCGSPNPESLHPSFRGPGWREVRLDISPSVKPDVVASIVDLAPVPSDSVDAVWSSHNLEHVYAHEAALALGAFFRVLRPGGEALVTMPDLQSVAALIAKGKLEDTAYVSPAGPISPLDMVYGHRDSVARGNEFMAHRTGYTAKTLRKKLEAAGFTQVVVQQKPHEFALWASAVKPVHGPS
jgi:SAM-dependent methyltransferase